METNKMRLQNLIGEVEESVKSGSITEKYADYVERCKELGLSSYTLNTLIHYAHENLKNQVADKEFEQTLFVKVEKKNNKAENEKIIIKEVEKTRFNWKACLVIVFLTTVVVSVFWKLFNSSDFRSQECFKVNGIPFNMIFVEGGTFLMGASDDEKLAWETPCHEVVLGDYYIGETEVTQELWKAVMGSNPSVYVGDKYPVDKVTFEEAVEFCEKLSVLTNRCFRLPTEAEWEYAARGGNKSKGFKYSGSNSIDEVAWYLGNSDSVAHSVKLKRPNELGLYDMSGNAYEMCSDWYARYSPNRKYNPQGLCVGWGKKNEKEGKVRRGGGWLNMAKYCRVTYRFYTPYNIGNNFLGLRLVMETIKAEAD